MATRPWAGTVCSALLMLTACVVRAIFVQMVHGSVRPSAVGTVDFCRSQRQAAGVREDHFRLLPIARRAVHIQAAASAAPAQG